MNDLYHAVVWVDHSEAKVFRFSGKEQSEVDIHAHASLQRLHHRQGGWEAGGNPPEHAEFFQRIAGALDHTGGTVVTGPGHAKEELKSYLDQHRSDVASRVFAVETLDHPTASGLFALGRQYFASAVLPQA